MGLQEPVPAAVAILLLFGSFFLGHFTQNLHETASVSETMQIGNVEAPASSDRHLQSLEEAKARVQAGKKHAPEGLDPTDTPLLERFMIESSGLLNVRPTLQSARSGDDFTRVMPFQILSWAPRLTVYPAFIDKERAQAIINMAKSSASQSGEEGNAQQGQTFSGTSISTASTDASSPLVWLEERIAAATLIPASHGDAFHILHHSDNLQADSPMDSFDPKEQGPQGKEHIATVMVFLEAPEEGGEIMFKREGFKGVKRQIKDWRDCSADEGYRYKPRQGDALFLWTSMTDGKLDVQSLYSSCPVLAGEKWVATKWFHTKAKQADRAAELDQALNTKASA